MPVSPSTSRVAVGTRQVTGTDNPGPCGGEAGAQPAPQTRTRALALGSTLGQGPEVPVLQPTLCGRPLQRPPGPREGAHLLPVRDGFPLDRGQSALNCLTWSVDETKAQTTNTLRAQNYSHCAPNAGGGPALPRPLEGVLPPPSEL